MKPNVRDLTIGFASIVFSLCAGIWTVYNYNVNQKKIELEAIFSITEKIEFIKLKEYFRAKKIIQGSEKSDSVEKDEIRKLTHALLPEVRARFHQIKKPFCMKTTEWNEKWNDFDFKIKNSFLEGFEKGGECVDVAWKAILKDKKVKIIGEITEQNLRNRIKECEDMGEIR
jgi:hypothetical protein